VAFAFNEQILGADMPQPMRMGDAFSGAIAPTFCLISYSICGALLSVNSLDPRELKGEDQ
jgi:hypothetical protein